MDLKMGMSRVSEKDGRKGGTDLEGPEVLPVTLEVTQAAEQRDGKLKCLLRFTSGPVACRYLGTDGAGHSVISLVAFCSVEEVRRFPQLQFLFDSTSTNFNPQFFGHRG